MRWTDTIDALCEDAAHPDSGGSRTGPCAHRVRAPTHRSEACEALSLHDSRDLRSARSRNSPARRHDNARCRAVTVTARGGRKPMELVRRSGAGKRRHPRNRPCRSPATWLEQGALRRSGPRPRRRAPKSIGDCALREQEALEGMGMVLDISRTHRPSTRSIETSRKAGTGLPGILVNNAGITRDNLFVRMKDDEWTSVIETNLSSLYRMCRGCARSMLRARAGRIINVSSISRRPGKRGTVQLRRGQGRNGGIHALPGARARGQEHHRERRGSGFHRHRHDARDASPNAARSCSRQIPAGQNGRRTDEVAAAVSFLASPRAAYITGQTLHVNGGLLMR